jgi:hypothetical protein
MVRRTPRRLLFGYRPKGRSCAKNNGLSTVLQWYNRSLQRGRARAEIKTRDNGSARTAETIRYNYGSHINKEKPLYMCLYWPHNSNDCDGPFPTRGSLNDRMGGVGGPRGLNLTVASSPLNNSCARCCVRRWLFIDAYSHHSSITPLITPSHHAFCPLHVHLTYKSCLHFRRCFRILQTQDQERPNLASVPFQSSTL